MRHQESTMQIACVKWFRLAFPSMARLLFSIPNGGFRSRVTAAIMKAEGTVAGVADLLLLYPSKGYHGLCIEMKTAKGRQQDSQKAWQKEVERVGYKYIVCRSAEQFAEEVKAYLYVEK